MPLPDHLFDLGPQTAVVEHLDVGREDRPVLAAQLLGDPIAIALDLFRGRAHRLVEPFQLHVDRVSRQEPPRDAESLGVHDEHFADRHAGRYGNPLKSFHAAFGGAAVAQIKDARRRLSRRCGLPARGCIGRRARGPSASGSCRHVNRQTAVSAMKRDADTRSTADGTPLVRTPVVPIWFAKNSSCWSQRPARGTRHALIDSLFTTTARRTQRNSVLCGQDLQVEQENPAQDSFENLLHHNPVDPV